MSYTDPEVSPEDERIEALIDERTNELDDYVGFDEEAARIERLFADPKFTQLERDRQILNPTGAQSANGSFGRAMALGFANIFDPDRVKDDIIVVQERGEGDGDVPETKIDPDDPTATKVIYKR
jgi:hypothetical protein